MLKSIVTLVVLIALAFTAAAQEEAVVTYQDGSSVRAEIVEAVGRMIREQHGQRIRFRPTRVATKGDWGFLFALPIEGEKLCYDPEADFWIGAAEIHALLYRFEGAWHVVMPGEELCYDDYDELEAWRRFAGFDLIGYPENE